MRAYLQRLSTPCTTQNERIATIKNHRMQRLSDLSTLEIFVDTRGTETQIETYAVGSPNHRY